MKRWLFIPFVLVVFAMTGFLYMQQESIPYDILKSRYANAQSAFMELDGMRVHYRIEGEGKPVVLIHGTGSCLQTWDGWTDSLVANGYQVIRPDMPAFGLTGPRPDGDYSVRKYVEFLDTFLTRLGVDQFAIGGNSLGGEIAWCYAATHPQKVKALLLVDPAGFYAKAKGNKALLFTLAKIEWLARIMAKIDTRLIVEQTLKDVYEDDAKIRPQTVQMYYDLSLREGNRESFSARVQQINSEKHPDIKTISAPTLIQWGKQDILIDISMAQHFKAIPGSRLIVYDGVGHSPQEEIPAQSVHDALRFLSAH